MIRFKDDSSLQIRKVKTVKGLTEYRRNCIQIGENWYVKDEDCVRINEKWYAHTSKLITFDPETQKWMIIKENPDLIYGVMGFKPSDGAPMFGYFTENKYNNVLLTVPNYGNVKTYNEKVVAESGWVEDISNGVWLDRKTLSPRDASRMNVITGRRVHTHKGYNLEDNPDEMREKIETFNKFPMKITASALKVGKLLGDVTYGAEIETSMGTLPDNVQHRTGVVICRDGSIDNAEFVTVPMKGARGLINLKYLSSELCKRTQTDIKCSLHFHLGNLPKDRFFIVALYALAMRIQDEMFTIFPYYKTKWQDYKRQNYNQKLRKLGIGLMKPGMKKEEYTQYIDEAYYRISTWLNEGVPPDDSFNRTTNHHAQSQKWNRKQRYFWINFMNMFFSERRTIEFRLHHNTLNGQKMVNWLFICNAICQYAVKNSASILSSDTPISLNTVLDYYGSHFKTEYAKFISEYLKAYITDRKAYFLADFKRGDYTSDKEQADDKTYVFSYQGVNWLF